jgi:aspartate/tyrosine/aromatic aminotransferase
MHADFSQIPLAPEDPILGLPYLFAKDENPNKVNLGIGSYRTADGRPYLLHTVAAVESQLASKVHFLEYLPLEGDPFFIEQSAALVFGIGYNSEKMAGMQTVGGVAALRLAADLIAKHLLSSMALPSPTWPNHDLIFESAKLQVHTYPYYNKAHHEVDFEPMVEALKKLPAGCAVLLQNACHNPTGADLSDVQWQTLVKIFQECQLVPFFDNAYQGFGYGMDKDVYPIRLFLDNGLDLIVANSYSKNFGLYGERVGSLFIVTSNKRAVLSQLKRNVRSIYSTPPCHGAKIVSTILSDPKLRQEWMEELGDMRQRIESMRKNLAEGLGDTYQFLRSQKGFFSLLGLSEAQVLYLREAKSIYMPLNGRINIAGLTPSHLTYVIDALVNL